ncbi:MAG: glycosyltransferase [Bacteroidales bacterium]|nr:glycosyltransferase [Bacteroidales bacterium]
MEKLNVLVNAYAVNPKWGSEPGMGWNWISNLAACCNLFIITEGEWRHEIEAAVHEHPFKDNLHFFYLPVSHRVRKMCWNQGDWRFYFHYRCWQKRAFKKAKEILAATRIDVVHQLNMVGFREPGYLWMLGKPVIWGPIGGIEEVPMRFLAKAPVNMKSFIRMKNLITWLQIRFDPHVDRAFRYSRALISAVPAAQEAIKTIKHRDSVLIPETGCYDLNTIPADKRERRDFHILWVGKFDYRKRLDLALEAIAKVKDLPGLHFHIAGTGTEKQVDGYKELAASLGIEDICVWHGKVPNDQVQVMMRDADLFFFTSISEATSTVVPEAINNCLPVLCFNACGFGPIVSERIGVKVEPKSPEEAVPEFAGHIRSLYNDRGLLHEMSLNCREVLQTLLWENKAKQVVEIYERCLNN